MDAIKHWAIFLTNKADKELLVNKLLGKEPVQIFNENAGGNGALFSAITIKKLVEEEELHGEIIVAVKVNRWLRYLSGGEQKKALLSFLLEKKPAFIIADNPFDNLDAASQVSLVQMFAEIQSEIPIIQLINRTADKLSFITNALRFSDDNKFVIYQDTGNEVVDDLKTEESLSFCGSMPASDNNFGLIVDPLIQFDNVTIRYGDTTIVKNISWQINSNQFWHLTGANGAGKTTLLSLITGDNPKAYGQNIILFGKRKGTGESVWSIKEKIGYFTASVTDLFSRHTNAAQMVISGFFDSIGLYSVASARQIKLADQWLAYINMLPLKKKLFHTLSPGQQRMILIVRSMVKHPPLLILDEPTAGLDELNAALVVALINKIAIETTTAILYVSHRKELGLNPDFRYELTAGETGSTGKVIYPETYL